MPRMTLPPGPMRSLILSEGIFFCRMAGASLDSSRVAGQGLLHLAEDVQAAVLGLLEGAAA